MWQLYAYVTGSDIRSRWNKTSVIVKVTQKEISTKMFTPF